MRVLRKVHLQVILLVALCAVLWNVNRIAQNANIVILILGGFQIFLTLILLLNIRSSESEQNRFQSLIDRLGETVFLCDENGKIKLINEHGKKSLGLFIGDTMAQKLISQNMLTLLKQKSSEEEPFLNYNVRYKDKDYSVRIQREESPRNYFSGTILDVTDSEKTQYYTKKYYKQSALAFLGSIFENLAHEIRTPCLAAEACFRMIQDDILEKMEEGKSLDEEDIESLRRYCQNGSRTTNQIADLLNQSRSFRHGYRKDDVGDIDLQEACTFCKETIEAAYNSIISGHISVNTCNEGPYLVKGYLNRFLEAFGNMLKNSVEAIMERTKNDPDTVPEIEIVLRREPVVGKPKPDEIITLEIIDNGCGFPEDLREHLGTAFCSTKQHNEHYKGTGLGLALAIRTINAMGGTWEIENRYREKEVIGTKTMIKIPLPQDLRYDVN